MRACAASATFGLARFATPRPAASIMATSFAPSPIASVSLGSRPRSERDSTSIASLASRPRIGSATVPESLSPSAISVLPRFSSKPTMAATRAVSSVKPPETRHV
jgi:hypothetical protein